VVEKGVVSFPRLSKRQSEPGYEGHSLSTLRKVARVLYAEGWVELEPKPSPPPTWIKITRFRQGAKR
jgi:hypothetical protein